jgi:phage baseplate assembly protein V
MAFEWMARIANLVSRAIVKRVDDGKKVQALQLGLLHDETRDNVERFQNYGFTSVPLAGAEAVVLFVGGYRDHGLTVMVDDRRYRLTGLAAGEVAIYTDEGDRVVLQRGGTITVTASTKVVVDAPLVELSGNTEAALKATTYRAADSTFDTAVAAAAAALGTAAGTWAGNPVTAPTFATAVGAFCAALAGAANTKEAGAAGFLSTKVKLS